MPCSGGTHPDNGALSTRWFEVNLATLTQASLLPGAAQRGQPPPGFQSVSFPGCPQKASARGVLWECDGLRRGGIGLISRSFRLHAVSKRFVRATMPIPAGLLHAPRDAAVLKLARLNRKVLCLHGHGLRSGAFRIPLIGQRDAPTGAVREAHAHGLRGARQSTYRRPPACRQPATSLPPAPRFPAHAPARRAE